MISSAQEKKPFRCAMCGTEVAVGAERDARRYFPFCSSRCKTADLANWARGSYAIPSRETVTTEEDEES